MDNEVHSRQSGLECFTKGMHLCQVRIIMARCAGSVVAGHGGAEREEEVLRQQAQMAETVLEVMVVMDLNYQ